MKKKFEIMSLIDNWRWDAECANNLGTINYAHEDMSDDLLLLSQWICYTTDRQMPFEQISALGGFVFSDMIKNYKEFGKGMSVLTIDSPESFFNLKPDGNYVFTSKTLAPKNNLVSTKYNQKPGEPVNFISRFYPSDYLSMLYTLNTLLQFERDFIEYVTAVIRCITSLPFSHKDLIQGIAYGLFILTYEDIGQIKKEQIDDDKWMIKAKERTERIMTTLADSVQFRNKVDAFYKRGRQYSIKRVWCPFRDYLKSHEFGENCFRPGLLSRGIEEEVVNMLFSDEAMRYFELPGDVWNNNSTFRKCLLKDEKLSAKETKMPFNKLLRLLFERQNIEVGYPEQFDITFDFVPRMCEKDKCRICPFKALSEQNDIDSVCADNKKKFCTVALACGGYICRCKGDGCALKKSLGEYRQK
ncbi:MAG: hypothetical protein Q8N36_04135 [bacterium]|nr:hypothetical protein [bacterium]